VDLISTIQKPVGTILNLAAPPACIPNPGINVGHSATSFCGATLFQNIDSHLLKTWGMAKTPLTYVVHVDVNVAPNGHDSAANYATVLEEMVAHMPTPTSPILKSTSRFGRSSVTPFMRLKPSTG
jgi:hypothetical protein